MISRQPRVQPPSDSHTLFSTVLDCHVLYPKSPGHLLLPLLHPQCHWVTSDSAQLEKHYNWAKISQLNKSKLDDVRACSPIPAQDPASSSLQLPSGEGQNKSAFHQPPVQSASSSQLSTNSRGRLPAAWHSSRPAKNTNSPTFQQTQICQCKQPPCSELP